MNEEIKRETMADKEPVKDGVKETEPDAAKEAMGKAEKTAQEAKKEADKIAKETTDKADEGTGEATEEAVETAEDSSKEAEKTEEEKQAEESERYMRLMAEFQNYKRRVESQKTDMVAYANEQLVTELLTVLDNFERALTTEGEGEAGYKEGIQMIFQQLSGVLTRAGLEEIQAEKAPFDPNYHNAVLMEDTDAVESNHVSEVLQKGYTLKGKVIRPSMVKVAN